MKRKNYLDEMVADIETYWFDEGNNERYEGEDPDDIYEGLNDDLFVSDSVTGNASGSYTFDRFRAMKGEAIDMFMRKHNLY